MRSSSMSHGSHGTGDVQGLTELCREASRLSNVFWNKAQIACYTSASDHTVKFLGLVAFVFKTLTSLLKNAQ